MTRVLFVDDEPQVLDSLRDAVRPRRHDWAMSFADSGEDALDRLDQEAYDVIVSDMRMNGMDGAALLGEIERSHPAAVRIVLSGSAERDVVVRAAAVAHRFLAKPCDVGERARVVERSCALRSLPASATRLPAAPRLHAELTALLRDGGATPADAAAIIERDIAMSARLLALAADESDYLEQVIARSRESGRPLFEVELEERGVSHAELGAHLLGQWGLPDSIVEAVAYHHRPAALPQPRLDAVAAVAIACALVDGDADPEYVAQIGAADRLDGW